MNTFSFGISGTHTLAETLSIVQKAEVAGMDQIWLSEDYFNSGVFTLLGASAERSKFIKIGVGVVNPFTRHPSLIAMESAAMDELSNGRFILGLGASNKKWMQMQAGIEFEKPITATTECAEIVRLILSGNEVSYKGECFEINNVRLTNQVLRPDMPIYFGVKGPKALQLAGKTADGILCSAGSPVEYISYVREKVAIGAREVGRNPEDIRIAAYLPIYCDDLNPQTAIAKVREAAANYLGLHGDHPILRTAGISRETIAPYREAFLNSSSIYPEVPAELVDKILIVGNEDHCLKRIQEYIDAGVDDLIFFEANEDIAVEDNLDMITDLVNKFKERA